MSGKIEGGVSYGGREILKLSDLEESEDLSGNRFMVKPIRMGELEVLNYNKSKVYSLEELSNDLAVVREVLGDKKDEVLFTYNNEFMGSWSFIEK